VIALLCLLLVALTLALVLWNVKAWPAIGTASATAPRAVSILIPARDEEPTIAICVRSALAQGDVVAEVVVYDDRSADRTAEVVQAISQRESRVRLLRGSELPPGWCGKPHACARLAEAAHGEWLLFLDADAWLRPGAASRMLHEARARQLTFLSAWPGFVMQSFWERVLMPLLNTLVFSLFPAPLSLLRQDASLGLAHGACILTHRSSYVAVGGHGAVREELFEDSRLAQVWRAKGERGLCLDGQTVVEVRMYRSSAQIWRGFQKNFYPAFRHSASFWGFLVWHLLIFVVPLLLLIVAPTPTAMAAGVGVITIRVLLAVRFAHPLWSVLFHLAAEAVLIGIAIASWWQCRSGRGVEWKGRRYRQAKYTQA